MRVPSIGLTILFCGAAVLITTSAMDVAERDYVRHVRGTVTIEEPVFIPELDAVDSVYPSLQGKMLVASPDMDDPYFAGTKIYMLEHTPEGAIGLVVNRGTAGGPVGLNRAFALHDDVDRADYVVERGVFVSVEPDVLEAIVERRDNAPDHARVFVGYAGWGPFQLDGEIRAGAWRIVDADAADVLH